MKKPALGGFKMDFSTLVDVSQRSCYSISYFSKKSSYIVPGSTAGVGTVVVLVVAPSKQLLIVPYSNWFN